MLVTKRRQPKAGVHIIVTQAVVKMTKKVKRGTKRIPLIPLTQRAICQRILTMTMIILGIQ